MVILFSGSSGATEQEILEILCAHGANAVCENRITAGGGAFTVVSQHKAADICLHSGVAVLLDHTARFNKLRLPAGITGICEDNNRNALAVFQKNRTPVITCGMNGKNTVTLSSMGEGLFFVALQRVLTDRNGQKIYPEEFRVRANKEYHPFSVMASAAVLLINGIRPGNF